MNVCSRFQKMKCVQMRTMFQQIHRTLDEWRNLNYTFLSKRKFREKLKRLYICKQLS